MVAGLVAAEEVVVEVVALLPHAELVAAVLREVAAEEEEVVLYWEHTKLRHGLVKTRATMHMEEVA